MSVPPEEVLQNVDPRAKSEYLAWRAATDLRTPYRWAGRLQLYASSCCMLQQLATAAAVAAEPPLRQPVWAPGDTLSYVSHSCFTDSLASITCRVAPEFLAGTKPEASWDVDVTPLIVFINARSGGRVGPELANVLSRSLGRSQVTTSIVSSLLMWHCHLNCHSSM